MLLAKHATLNFPGLQGTGWMGPQLYGWLCHCIALHALPTYLGRSLAPTANHAFTLHCRSPAEGAYSEGFIKAKFTQDFCIGVVQGERT